MKDTLKNMLETGEAVVHIINEVGGGLQRDGQAMGADKIM